MLMKRSIPHAFLQDADTTTIDACNTVQALLASATDRDVASVDMQADSGTACSLMAEACVSYCVLV